MLSIGCHLTVILVYMMQVGEEYFGGSIYKTDGSHGCVNAPEYLAKKIYENIDQELLLFVIKKNRKENINIIGKIVTGIVDRKMEHIILNIKKFIIQLIMDILKG